MRTFVILIAFIAIPLSGSYAEVGMWWGEEGEFPFIETADSPIFTSYPGGLVIDWQRKVAIVSGRSSVSGPMTLENRSKILKSAVDQAFNKLANTIGLIRVDGFTRLSDLMDNDFALRGKVLDLIRKSYRIVREKVYKTEGMLEVTIEFDLAGKKGLSGTLFPAYLGKLFASSLPDRQAGPTPLPAPPSQITSEAYSGLIVDASDLGIEGGLAPRILSEDGSEIFSIRKGVDKSALITSGCVDYALASTQTSEEVFRAGDSPLIIPALKKLKSTYDCDIVIASSEAENIRQADKSGGFLRKLKVVILL